MLHNSICKTINKIYIETLKHNFSNLFYRIEFMESINKLKSIIFWILTK